MQAQELFHDDFRDALKHAIKALGGFDTVGADLWPSKTRKAAGAWLSDCLNPERPAKLDLEEISQILKMAREKHIHCALYQLCNEVGYVDPEIASPPSPEQKLAKQMAHVANEYQRLADEFAALERSNDARTLRAVHSLDR